MKILFVCHGNICRSVMAEMIMRHMLQQRGIQNVEVDSCATSTEELGNNIYPPAQRCLKEHHVPFTSHQARQITRADFETFDAIYCMDRNNLRNLFRMFDNLSLKAQLLLDRDVADPWYTGDFETTYRDVVAGCETILTNLNQ